MVKLTGVMCLAAVLALVIFWTVRYVGAEVVDRCYMSEQAVNARLTKQIGSFREFVRNEQINSTDIYAIGAWNREHPFTQLTIVGLSATIKSDVSGAELVANDSGLVLRTGESASSGQFPVNFRDGVFPVTVNDRSKGLYQAGVDWASLVSAAVVLLTVVLIYTQTLTKAVRMLSRQVRKVSQGDLQMQICPSSRDEIGQLAQDVDTMRLNIIDKLQREEAAWAANSQLITAISHDVRTPLTALMGYLDIASDDSLTPQERDAYLAICKNNALRLKSLTDELFAFFLVFGKPQPDQNLEEVDACTLLDQILLEQEMNLTQKGFTVRIVHRGELHGKLWVDVGHIRRIFDNLYSNVCKYADPERPVNALIEGEQDKLTVYLSNYIRLRADRVESNRIGLQTCEKLVKAMGGSFGTCRDQQSFSAEISLPLIREVESPEG